MRILRLDLGRELPTIDLHPFVTVVGGLGIDARSRLLAAVQALADGREPGVGGLVEHDGLLMELNPASTLPPASPSGRPVTLDADRLPVDTPDHVPGLLAHLDQVARQAAVDDARLEELRTQLDLSVGAELDRSSDDSAGELAAARQAVGAALAAWAATPATVFVPAPWALHLSRQWAQLRRRGAACEARLAELNRQVATASRRLAAAVAALDDAEAVAVPVLLSADEENRLAELATRPLHRGRLRAAKGRPEEDQVEIDELLARAGQPTYAAYVMFRLAPTPPPEHLAAIGSARRAVAAAEAELADATRARDEDPDLAAHRQRREVLRAQAAEHLGPLLPDDLHQVLAGQGEHQPNPDREPARRHLLELAARHGVECPDGADDAQLSDRVERWLAAGAATAGGATATDRGGLERRLARHERALAAIDAAERRAEHSRRLVGEVEARIAAVGRRPVPTPGSVAAAVGRLVAEVAPGAGRTVPLVLTGSFDGFPAGSVRQLLERLELEVARVQVVVVTDHPEAARWADEAGLRRAGTAAGADRGR